MTPFLVKLRQSVLPWRLTSLSPVKAHAGARQHRGGPTRWLGRRRTADKPRRLRIISSISHWHPRLWLPTDNNYIYTATRHHNSSHESDAGPISLAHLATLAMFEENIEVFKEFNNSNNFD